MATATKPDRPSTIWTERTERAAAAPASQLDPDVEKRLITPTQVLASAAAAASAFAVASLFGVSGTLVGTALFSVVATVATALYQNSLSRTSTVLRHARLLGEPPVADTPGSPGPVAANALPSWLDPRAMPASVTPAAAGGPAPTGRGDGPYRALARSGGSARLKGLAAVLIAMAAAFGITAGAIATVTSGIGQTSQQPSGDRGGSRPAPSSSQSSAGSQDAGSQGAGLTGDQGSSSTDPSTDGTTTDSPSASPSPTDTTPSTTPGTTVVPSEPGTP